MSLLRNYYPLLLKQVRFPHTKFRSKNTITAFMNAKLVSIGLELKLQVIPQPKIQGVKASLLWSTADEREVLTFVSGSLPKSKTFMPLLDSPYPIVYYSSCRVKQKLKDRLREIAEENNLIFQNISLLNLDFTEKGVFVFSPNLKKNKIWLLAKPINMIERS